MNGCPLCGSTSGSRIDLSGGRAPLYRCRGCGAVHWGQVWNDETASDYYHHYYARKPVAYDPITERRYHAILDRFERLRAPGRLLDVGCGMGHFLTVAEARGWQPVGLEVSVSGVEALGRLKAEGGRRFEVCQGDLLHAELPGGGFDAVTMFEVLEHLADPMANLRKIHTLLGRGGLLYLTTPNFDSVSRYALGGHWRAIAREHLCLFNVVTLQKSLDAAGFHPLRLRTKNVDVPAILARCRRRVASGPATSTFPATRALRRTIEESAMLRGLKWAANAALGMAGLGETIEALAMSRPA